MSEPVMQPASAAPFRRGTIFAVVAVGFAVFLAMLYFIGAGDTGDHGRGGEASAASNGLNGYSALVRLLEANDIDVDRSRSLSGLETRSLVILTPSLDTDPADLAKVLRNRETIGPTLVILPKWVALPPPQNMPGEASERIGKDWVRLGNPTAIGWMQELPAPYDFEQLVGTSTSGDTARWSGFDRQGSLPTEATAYAKDNGSYRPLVTDEAGRALVLEVEFPPDTIVPHVEHSAIFVVEPDLVNNYALADPERAALALDLVRDAGYNEVESIVFDLTFAGLGGSMNLLTLAFQPPFLAATLCLVLALIAVGWRAFLRFGPNSVAASEFAYGKTQLVENGAGLVVRSQRARLLVRPYGRLMARRIARLLGLRKADPIAIDAAVARRLPTERSFADRLAALHAAHSTSEILRASQSLDELTRKLTK
ncbi:DUF4350 domain-containing protein [Erythrobacter sp.]|uniref:DUF4350 domain-containing protein n=1 Tax=Erythrobacter sp. TaxID=1042 RepID=UPI003C772EA2